MYENDNHNKRAFSKLQNTPVMEIIHVYTFHATNDKEFMF